MTPLLLWWLLALGQSPDQATARHPASDSASFDLLAKRADQARQESHPKDAIALYQGALKLKPDWKEGWWYLGSLYYRENQYPECRDAFHELISLGEKRAPAWLLLGLCEFETKDYDASLASLNHGVELGSSGTPEIDEVAKYHLAILLTRYEAYEKSLNVLIELDQAGRNSPALIEAAGIAALRKPLFPKDLPAADREIAFLAGKAVWDAGVRRAAEAQKDFDTLLAQYPSAPGVHFLYGSFLLQQQPDKAIPELEKELEISPSHVPARVQIAAEYLRRGEPAKGATYATEAARLAPDSYVAHTILGRILAETGDLQSGIRELERAERLAPDSPQPRIALASAYAKAGRSEDAARERREFLRLKALYKAPGEQ